MNIEKIIRISRNESRLEVIKMILANRIDFYCGDDVGAAVSILKFDDLAKDIIFYIDHENAKQEQQHQSEGGNAQGKLTQQTKRAE